MVGIASANTEIEIESQQGGMWTEYYKGATKGDYYMVYNPTYDIWQEAEPKDVLGVACSSWTLNTTTGKYDPPIAKPTIVSNATYVGDESVYQADNTQGWVTI